jgi:hypothetical protein
MMMMMCVTQGQRGSGRACMRAWDEGIPAVRVRVRCAGARGQRGQRPGRAQQGLHHTPYDGHHHPYGICPYVVRIVWGSYTGLTRWGNPLEMSVCRMVYLVWIVWRMMQRWGTAGTREHCPTHENAL